MTLIKPQKDPATISPHSQHISVTGNADLLDLPQLIKEISKKPGIFYSGKRYY